MSEEITRYVEGVRRALADVPPAVRDELLEDLAEHLAEIVAEQPGRLVDLLGPPEVYAAELRAAAGIAPPVVAPNLDDRIRGVVTKTRPRLRRLDVRIGELIGYPRASDFLRLLRPGWWVLRGYLAALLLSYILDGGLYRLVPTLDHSRIAGLLLLAVAVAGSIWLGRRAGQLRRLPRLAVLAGNAAAVVFCLAILFDSSRAPYGYADFEPVYNHDPYSHVQDVYVYDSEGRLVKGARLFDEKGQVIRLGDPWRCARSEDDVSDYDSRAYPYCPTLAPWPGLGSGEPISSSPSPEVSPSPAATPGVTPTSSVMPVVPSAESNGSTPDR